MHVSAAPFAKYNADGTGRDTYIRRDPVECFGKNLYKAEPRLITRMGAAGSAIPRIRPKKLGQEDPVGGHLGGGGFERSDRFMPEKATTYPIAVNRFTTMKELMQDCHVSSGQMPGHLNHVSNYAGFQPRCPPATVGSAEWAEISHGIVDSMTAPPEPESQPDAEAPAAEA